MQLLAAASHYEGLERLKWLCEHMLKKRIDLQNVYSILAELERFANLVKYMKDYCLRFAGLLLFLKHLFTNLAVDHYNDFVANKEGVKVLGIDLFQEFLDINQQHKDGGKIQNTLNNISGELKPVANAVPPPSTFIKDLQTLYQTKKGTDINWRVVAPNMYGISGTIFPAHKASLKLDLVIFSLSKLCLQELRDWVLQLTSLHLFQVKGIRQLFQLRESLRNPLKPS